MPLPPVVVTGFRENLRFLGLGNLLGAVVMFSYFNWVDPQGTTAVGPVDYVFFAVAFGTLVAVGAVLGLRLNRPITDAARAMATGVPAEVASTPEVRRYALALPLTLAALSFAGWMMAAVIWGFLWPWLKGQFLLSTALRVAFGNVVVGGTVTSAFTFFAVEWAWRRRLPAFFPDGTLAGADRAFRLPVAARLTVAFLLVSVLPLSVLAMVTANRARAVLGADPLSAAIVLDDLITVVMFILVTGVVAALVLSRLVSRSVAEPLRRLEQAMAEVARGRLDERLPVVGNDEIGAVVEGFNRMTQGLREREAMRTAFGKYVTEEIRDEILAGALEPQTREVTVLFADLRDFTPWVEATAPAEVVRDLNAYFSEMEQAIREQGGLVLQYIGDEIEAVFGAPGRVPDHAARAVAAAKSMRARLAAWNAARSRDGKLALRHGIGVHSGTVLAGSIGSEDRLSYTLVGDAVNLASRIQGLTKEVGTDIVISGATAAYLDGTVGLERLPAARVKGKSAEVEVFRVI
jgi:class 3 adenylate cyclase